MFSPMFKLPVCFSCMFWGNNYSVEIARVSALQKRFERKIMGVVRCMEKIRKNIYFSAGAFSSPPVRSGSPGPGLPDLFSEWKKLLYHTSRLTIFSIRPLIIRFSHHLIVDGAR